MQKFMPQTIDELQERCKALAGRSLADLSQELNVSIPENLLHAKGWVGQLIETFLGCSANNKALPDFPNLGIELKTIPINRNYKPLESTYVCTVQANTCTHWRDSWVYNKLRHVLWVPIFSDPDLTLKDRKIASPILWQMDPETEATLRTDWEELMEMLQLGFGKKLSAKFGTYLHIRPKAANSDVLQDYIDEAGNKTKIVPKGFYLRAAFTEQLCKT